MVAVSAPLTQPCHPQTGHGGSGCERGRWHHQAGQAAVLQRSRVGVRLYFSRTASAGVFFRSAVLDGTARRSQLAINSDRPKAMAARGLLDNAFHCVLDPLLES